MKRRRFVEILALAGTLLAAGKTFAEKIIKGRCGATCSRCEQYESKACGGCGSGEKEQCIVYKCNSRRGMSSCSQCRLFACARHQRINPPSSARA